MDMDDEMIERLILDGIVEFAGLDKDGEMLYSFAPNIEKLAPFIFEAIMNEHRNDVTALWQEGFLDMDVTKDNPVVKITPRALNEEALNSLPPHLRSVLEAIKHRMLN